VVGVPVLVFDSRLGRAEGAIFLQVSHGYIINKDERDPFISVVEQAAHEFYIATRPGKWLVDTFPIRMCLDHSTGYDSSPI
jgi:hypothetical protein